MSAVQARFIAAMMSALAILANCTHPPSMLRTEITIAQGRLNGASRNGIERFLNIPFAAAPVADMRWRPPGAAPTRSGVRDATAFGPSCPQPVRPAIVAGGVADRQSEDCLQLNIWRPASATRLPVMVWLHGGAHVIGSGTFPAFDGSQLARDGVIVVTINYRLGALGYFAHPALTAEAAASETPIGNYGLMDQIAALEWVRANIAAFGGDPARVTVFGESAGAIDIVTLLTIPQAAGLFSSAIVQSGINLFEPNPLAQQEQLGLALASRAGVSVQANAGDLRQISTEALLAASAGRGAGLTNPIIDGNLVRQAPWRAYAEGNATPLPLLIGANSNEASVVFALGVAPETAHEHAGADAAANTAYQLAVTDREFARQVLGDAWFVAPARWIAARASSRAPAYLYHFDYTPTAIRNTSPGAAHSAEVPFIFQSLDYLQTLGVPASQEDRNFAHAISACWTSFARMGRPVCALATNWSAYDANTDELTLFGAQSRTVRGFRKPQLDLIMSRREARVAPPDHARLQ